METKTIIYGIAILVLIVLLIYLFGFSRPPSNGERAQINKNSISLNQKLVGEKIPIEIAKSKFEFEGYGPGKSHIGTFKEYSGHLYLDNGLITGVEGKINPSSVDTGIDGLDEHLKNEDFFDVEKFAEIRFISSNIDHTKGEVTGDLTFHGVTNKVTFPVEITDSSISADFILDTTPFKMKHTGVNKEVRIAFEYYI